MKKGILISAVILVGLLPGLMMGMQGPYLLKYNQAAVIPFDLCDSNSPHVLNDALTPAAGDVRIIRYHRNSGTWSDEIVVADTFDDRGRIYSIDLTATEMRAAKVILIVKDQTAPRAWADTSIVIQTFGDANASNALDFDAASSAQTGDSYVKVNACIDANGTAKSDLYSVGGHTGTVTNIGTVFYTDFADDYNDVVNTWRSDVNTVRGEVPVGDDRFDTLDASIGGMRADVNTANTEITTTEGYALDAKTASELIDTRDELLTLLTGGTSDLATEPNLTLVLADTSAVDTRNELLTLLTGGILDLATEVNETTILGRIPASVALHTDPNDALQSRGYTSTVSGRIDIKISDVNAGGDGNSLYIYAISTTVAEANSAIQFNLTGGVQNDDAFVNNVIAVKDANDSHWEIRYIKSYTGTTRTIVVNKAFTFIPAAGDTVHILETAYIRNPLEEWPYK